MLFRFDTDTTAGGRGFRKQEVQTAYAVVYANSDLTQPLDTFRQALPGTRPSPSGQILTIYPMPPNSLQLYLGKVVGGQTPWPGYRIVVPASQRTFEVRNTELEFKERNDRCDGVYLKQIRFTLNGQLLELPPVHECVVLSK
ncbi:hypothetical protein [Hymenobacter wooponensis]|uniref:hypothetical protein n=1 Tax=Hymenobacter wooponensis TaxID=1525360 RepID=UPI0010804C30|nr:hypothetical protein [Hymenobacter wooponensis]